MKNSEKKAKLYNLFSQNLKWLSEEPKINFDVDCTDKYLCPLCVQLFSREDLLEASKNPLTLEDVPPKSLGGKVRTLTCKSCNNTGGHGLDAHLFNRLKELDFLSFSPNSGKRVKLKIDEYEVNGQIHVDENGTAIINPLTDHSNPAIASEFSKRYGNKELYKEGLPMTFTVSHQSDKRRAHVALLRIAYLIAYSTFGNGFLINGNLNKVRAQLLNPDKEILKVFWIKYDFDEEDCGINIISSPKELRCYLIVFDLITPSRSLRCGIALPGPSEDADNIYQNIEEILCRDNMVETRIEHIGEDDFLKNPSLTLDSIKLWNYHCS